MCCAREFVTLLYWTDWDWEKIAAIRKQTVRMIVIDWLNMIRSQNADHAPVHWACDNARLLEQTTPLLFDQICGHKIAPTLIWSTERYGASSSSDNISCGCITSSKWSNTCRTFRVAWTTASLTTAIDERCGHLRACMQANYRHLSNCCDSVNIHLATRHEIFIFSHTMWFRNFNEFLFSNTQGNAAR